jgi:hypothetical protein
MLDRARRRPDLRQHHGRNPSVPESVGNQFPAVASEVSTTATAATHIATQEQFDGNAVDWMEKVSDEQYRKS